MPCPAKRPSAANGHRSIQHDEIRRPIQAMPEIDAASPRVHDPVPRSCSSVPPCRQARRVADCSPGINVGSSGRIWKRGAVIPRVISTGRIRRQGDAGAPGFGLSRRRRIDCAPRSDAERMPDAVRDGSRTACRERSLRPCFESGRVECEESRRRIGKGWTFADGQAPPNMLVIRSRSGTILYSLARASANIRAKSSASRS